MSSGTGGTLILKPHGGDELTLNLFRTDPTGVETYALFVNLGELRLNEAARIQWNYDESQHGGLAVNMKGGIIPVVLPIRITATTSPARVDAYNALMIATTNLRGGVLEYKPEGHTSSTFYHYQPSPSPNLLQSASNRWDRAAESDGFFVLNVEVELMTQPYATSDPDVAINLIAAGQADQTVIAGEGTYADIGLGDKLEIDNLGGVAGVLTRVLAFGAGGQDVGRVISFIKSGDGKDADHIIDSSQATIVGESAYWSTVVDADRYGGSYLRLHPLDDLDNVEYTHRYTIPNPEYWNGRIAVFVSGYDGSWVTGEWTHKAVLRFGAKAVQTSDVNHSRLYGNWQLTYVGELQIPPTALSLEEQDAGYGVTCYIDIVSTRVSGASAFNFESLLLVQVSDENGTGAVLDVVCDQEDAIDSGSRLLMENRVGQNGQPLEVAHALTSGDLAFSRTLSAAPRGRFMTLDPAKESTVRFIHEMALAEPYIEDSASYDGVYNLTLGTFYTDKSPFPAFFSTKESAEGWALTSASILSEFNIIASYALNEGSYGGQILVTPSAGVDGYGRIERNVALDFSSPSGVFTEDDMLCFTRWWDHVAGEVTFARVGFVDGGGLMAYTTIQTLTTGYVNRAVRRSDLTLDDGFDWSYIQKVFADYGVEAGSDESELALDFIRVEKRSYGKPSEPNCTGGQWEFDEGKNWAVTTDMAVYRYTFWTSGLSPEGWRRDLGYTIAGLGFLDTDIGFAILQEDAPEYFQLSARLTNHWFYNGWIGLIYCVDDDILDGSENYYAVIYHLTSPVGGSWIYLAKYVAGVRGEPGTYILADVDLPLSILYKEPLYVGVRVNRTTGKHKIYVVTESNTESDYDLWDADNLLWDFTDTDFMENTKVGVMNTQNGQVRADKFILMDANNRVNPSDDLRVAVQGQYRTIIPLT